jgi:hypothetical protein
MIAMLQKILWPLHSLLRGETMLWKGLGLVERLGIGCLLGLAVVVGLGVVGGGGV